MSEMSLEEARELEQLTARIVQNLKQIDELANYSVDDLEEQTSSIVSALQTIKENENDLDELLEQTNQVVANLLTINQDENDLDAMKANA